MLEAADMIDEMRAALGYAVGVFGNRSPDRDDITEQDGIEFNALCRLMAAIEKAKGA